MSSITKIKVADTIYDIKDNVSGYITKDVDDLTNYYDKEQVDFNIEQVSDEIPTRTSQLTNDSGFIGTAALAGKQDTLISGSNVKTINGQNILGSGNLVVESQGEINLVDDVRINGVSILDNKVADFYISDHYSSTNGIITNYELQNAIDAVETEITAQGRLIPTKTSDLINDSNFISGSALDNYALSSETANSMTMEVNTDYVLTSKLKDKNGLVIDTATVDLPIEGLVMNGRYDTATKKIILTLKNGNTIEFSIADLISDRQPLIDSTHKLDSDLINTTGQTNQFVLASDKANWNAKQNPIIAGTGITVSGSQVSVTNYNSILSSINSKQDLLTSGVNIKTINNQSLLGSGNINIQGGGGAVQDVQVDGTSVLVGGIAQIDLSNKQDITLMVNIVDEDNMIIDSTSSEIYEALINGRAVNLVGMNLSLVEYHDDDDELVVSSYYGIGGYNFTIHENQITDLINVEFENLNNKEYTLSSSSDNYPSSSAVKNYVDEHDSFKQDKPTIVTMTTANITLENNTEYRYSGAASLNVTLPNTLQIDFICSLAFSSGSTATVFTAPNTIKWIGDGVDNNVFTPEANTRYNIIFWYDGVNVNAVVRGV